MGAGDATIGSAFVQLVPSAQGMGAAVTKEVAKELGGSEVSNAATKAGESAGSSLAGGVTKVIGGAALGVGAVATVGAGVGAGLLKIASGFDDAFDSIQVKTGATAQVMDGLKGDFNQVFSTIPTSSENAATAIGTLNQKLGITGEPLQNLSKQVLELSRITGTDLNANIKGVTDTFNNWGVSSEQQGSALDDLFRVSQKTGVGVDVLSGQMADNGVVLRQAGLNFDQAAVFLGGLAKSGIDAGDAMPALSKALATAAKDGKGAQQVLDETFKAIKDAPNDTAAATVAMDVFGARAGPKLAASIREGKVSLTDLNTAMATTGDGVIATADKTADFPEKLKTAFNSVQVALQPLAMKVMDFVTNVATKAGPLITDAFAKIGPVLENIGNKVAPVFESITGAVGGFFSTLTTGLTENDAPTLFEKIALAARGIWDAISNIDWKSVFSTAVAFISPVVDAITNLASSITDFAISAFTILKQLVIDNQDTLKAVGEKILEVAGFLRDTLLGAVDKVSGVFDFLATHMDAVRAVAVPLIAAFAIYKTVMLGIQAVTTAVTLATQIWTGVQAALNVVMSLNPIGIVIAAIAALVAGVIYAYTHFDTFRNIVDAFGNAILWVFNWVKDNWPTILAIITGPVGVAVLLITKNWDTIKEGVSAMIDFVVGAFNGFVDFVTSLPGKIVSALGDFAGLLVSKGKDLILGLINGYIGAYAFLINELGQLASKVLGWIGDATNWLVSTGINIIRGILNGIYQGESDLVRFFINLGSSILGWIGDLGNILWNAGIQLIQGFVGGIKSMFGAVKDTLGNLTSALTSWKGPPSKDKTLLTNSGILVIQGFINGLESMYPQVQGSLAGLTADLAATPLDFAATGSVGLAGRSVQGVPSQALTGPSTVVNLWQTNNTNATPNDIAKATTFSLATAGVPV